MKELFMWIEKMEDEEIAAYNQLLKTIYERGLEESDTCVRRMEKTCK